MALTRILLQGAQQLAVDFVELMDFLHVWPISEIVLHMISVSPRD
jgi:hypothetical protein